MADDEVAAGWSVRPDNQRTLRRRRAREAVAKRQHRAAILEAEELLDEVPDDPDALWTVAEACMELEDWAVARAAWHDLLRVGGERAVWRAQAASAALYAGDVDGAATDAAQALAVWPDLALGHHVQACALEHQGRLDEAAEHHHLAHRLDPLAHPLPLPLDASTWRQLIAAAIRLCTPPVQALWADLPVVLGEFAPARRDDPEGIHDLIWGEPGDDGKPQHLVVYVRCVARSPTVEAALEHVADELAEEAARWGVEIEP